jgi:hypothetical protein
MVHPTCAPARHPNVPSEDDISALVLQVKAEISALSEVHRAVACVRNLLLQMQRSSAEERFASPAELNALVKGLPDTAAQNACRIPNSVPLDARLGAVVEPASACVAPLRLRR